MTTSLRFAALISCSITFAASASAQNQVLVPERSTWRYLADGTDPGTAWRERDFSVQSWTLARGQIGYGDADAASEIAPPASGSRPITTYFRKTFTVSDPKAFTGLLLRLLRDDGAIVYLNGTEIARSNMGAEPANSQTLALSAAEGRDEGTPVFIEASDAPLVRGRNVLAVEVHQATEDSPDLSFDCELVASRRAEPAFVTRGPYLQSVGQTGATICWRTNVPTKSVVSWGKRPRGTMMSIATPGQTTDHQVRITGRDPDTLYYYSVGDGRVVLEGRNPKHYFRTNTAPGTVKPLRIWVIGDSGTGGDGTGRAEAVRDGYRSSADYRPPHLWLMLGDNAYEVGTDQEYQSAVFQTYRKLLRSTPLWPTIGNHETFTPSIPYFSIFALPTQAEAGGLASGTERYYSFDQANVHFVCLDSMISSRQPAGPMLTWLTNDLKATSQPWVIAYWHHPPYSKGSHDSDVEGELVEMRKNVLPILEAHGVDLVLAGHSHSYERSVLLDGHYGTSDTLNKDTMFRNGGDGREFGDGAYTKFTKQRAGAVYTVCGVSGKAGGGALNHPVMVISRDDILGSMVLEIEGNRLDARFLDSTGAERDQFTIVKAGAAAQP